MSTNELKVHRSKGKLSELIRKELEEMDGVKSVLVEGDTHVRGDILYAQSASHVDIDCKEDIAYITIIPDKKWFVKNKVRLSTIRQALEQKLGLKPFKESKVKGMHYRHCVRMVPYAWTHEELYDHVVIRALDQNKLKVVNLYNTLMQYMRNLEPKYKPQLQE
ncbi:hypothetical protein ACFL1H_05690 [Nanoarchaeota archaeon]